MIFLPSFAATNAFVCACPILRANADNDLPINSNRFSASGSPGCSSFQVFITTLIAFFLAATEFPFSFSISFFMTVANFGGTESGAFQSSFALPTPALADFVTASMETPVRF